MAVLSTSALTLVDIAKRLDPNGKPARIIELLSQRNDVVNDMVWVEGNLPTGMRTTVRTGLPAVAWRLLNQGVAPSKSVTAQMDEQCGMLEAYSEVDKDLAELNGNTGDYRLQEAKAFLEAMSQEFTQTLFYGNAGVAPEEFTGLAARYSSLNVAAPSSQNVISAGGSGSDNASIYLIGWGDNTVHGIYPKGSQAGLVHEDIGLTTVEVSTGVGGNRMRAYLDRWQWKCGIALRDWRYVVRIPNIDISNLVTKSSAADLIELMIRAIHRIPNLSGCRPAFYMNRTCFQMLDIQRRDDVQNGGQLTYDMVDGKVVTSFRGIPIRLVDQLLENEAVVS